MNKDAPVVISRVHVFDVERFARTRQHRMKWAAILTLVFIVAIAWACLWLLPFL